MKELSPIYIYRAQWRATFRYNGHNQHTGMLHNKFSVFLIAVVPVLMTLVSFILNTIIIVKPRRVKLTDNLLALDDTLLAALAILAGALITAFSLLASWRNSVKAKTQGSDDYAPERWLLDASSAHLLAGAYSSIIASLIVMLTKAISIFSAPWIMVVGNSLAIGFSSHVTMSLLIALPSLYAAYVQLNDVDPFLNGQNDI